jgi:hypothetical protein
MEDGRAGMGLTGPDDGVGHGGVPDGLGAEEGLDVHVAGHAAHGFHEAVAVGADGHDLRDDEHALLFGGEPAHGGEAVGPGHADVLPRRVGGDDRPAFLLGDVHERRVGLVVVGPEGGAIDEDVVGGAAAADTDVRDPVVDVHLLVAGEHLHGEDAVPIPESEDGALGVMPDLVIVSLAKEDDIGPLNGILELRPVEARAGLLAAGDDHGSAVRRGVEQVGIVGPVLLGALVLAAGEEAVGGAAGEDHHGQQHQDPEECSHRYTMHQEFPVVKGKEAPWRGLVRGAGGEPTSGEAC